MASEKFGVSVDYIVFRILEKPKKGFLGLGKKEEYVVGRLRADGNTGCCAGTCRTGRTGSGGETRSPRSSAGNRSGTAGGKDRGSRTGRSHCG